MRILVVDDDLGLAIVRQAAEAHGGWVQAANAPGGGALLRVNFGAPLDPDPAEADQEAGLTGMANSG